MRSSVLTLITLSLLGLTAANPIAMPEALGERLAYFGGFEVVKRSAPPLSTTPAAPSTTPRAPTTTPAAPTTTPAAPSTTPRAPTTTPAAPSTTPSTTASTTASTTPACSIPTPTCANPGPQQTYIKEPCFPNTKVCYPTTYYAAQDQGQMSISNGPFDDQIYNKCKAVCDTQSQCASFVGTENITPDGNLATGTCFFYSSQSISPRQCADSPSRIIAYFRQGVCSN